jgi:hypothetical protein
VLTVTVDEPSATRAVSVTVGTLVKLHVLIGSHHDIVDLQSPRVGDRSILEGYPLGPDDEVQNGLATEYLAVRRGSTTIFVGVLSTAITYQVTVT